MICPWPPWPGNMVRPATRSAGRSTVRTELGGIHRPPNKPPLAEGHQGLVARNPCAPFLCDNCCREEFLSIPQKLITRPSRVLRKNDRFLCI